MELMNDMVLNIIVVTVIAAALILITALTGQVKDKDKDKDVTKHSIAILWVTSVLLLA
jgi:hypothetical protein